MLRRFNFVALGFRMNFSPLIKRIRSPGLLSVDDTDTKLDLFVFKMFLEVVGGETTDFCNLVFVDL